MKNVPMLLLFLSYTIELETTFNVEDVEDNPIETIPHTNILIS